MVNQFPNTTIDKAKINNRNETERACEKRKQQHPQQKLKEKPKSYFKLLFPHIKLLADVRIVAKSWIVFEFRSAFNVFNDRVPIVLDCMAVWWCERRRFCWQRIRTSRGGEREILRKTKLNERTIEWMENSCMEMEKFRLLAKAIISDMTMPMNWIFDVNIYAWVCVRASVCGSACMFVYVYDFKWMFLCANVQKMAHITYIQLLWQRRAERSGKIDEQTIP